MKKSFLLLIVLLFYFPITLATTLQGTIYDISLESAENVRVSIDTTPSQLIISKDSTYSFNIPIGSYTLTAEQYEDSILIASAEELISIQDEGNYVLDIILFPTFEDIIDESEFVDTSTDELIDSQNYNFIMILGILLIILAIFLYYKKKKKPKKQVQSKKKTTIKSKPTPEKITHILPPDLLELYTFIQKHKRTTQKEIRKIIPLSEAKISLMISDLESRNLITKLKKGRGNIIILK